jgi:PKD repeat protein/predicted secreted protein
LLRKTVSGMVLTLLLLGIATLTFNIRPAKAEPSEPPLTEWSKTYGGTNDDEAWCVVQTTDGGYALAGYSSSFGAGGEDFWLVKTDSSGNAQWNKTYGGTGREQATSMVQASDDRYVLAGFSSSFGAGGEDFWLVKTDANGNMQWNKTYGGTNTDGAFSVTQTSDGGYAMAGYTASFGAGGEDFWLVKTDAVGNAQWNKTYGGAYDECASHILQTIDGGYLLTGDTRSFGADGSDIWLVKTDSDGNMQWNKTYGGPNDDYGHSAVQTSDGEYAITGGFGHAGFYLDFWLVKTDASGNMLWNKTYGGTDQENPLGLIQTSDGGYVMAGLTYSFGAGSQDGWLVKTDSAGNMMWNKTYGGASMDYLGNNMVQTSDGGYALTGWTESFGAGGPDFWLIKLAPEMKPPTASFTYSPLDPYVTETVTFDASASYDPDGTIVSYLWAFGDGSTGNGVTTSHVYGAGGTYTVALTVVDNDGLNFTTTTNITVLRTTMNVQVKAGSIHFGGEIAEFYILVSSLGKPIDANINATLYYNGTLYANLSTSVEHVSLGLYRTPYTIPLNAPSGTYVLVVNASYLTLSGISLESFLLSPTFTGWNPLLININGTTATIKTDLGLITVRLDAINATVTRIDGTTATIQTTLGVMNGTITQIDNNTATIVTPIGTIEADISSLKGTQETWTIPLQYLITALALIAAAASTFSIIMIRRRKTA